MITTVSPIQALEVIKTLPQGSYAIVDVRSADEFAHSHVEGSMNMPLDTVLNHTETLRAYQKVFLYCRSGNRSGQACVRLHDANLANVVSIEGGIDAMKKAGFATNQTSRVLPLQQQVFIGAGLLVGVGTLLSAFVSSWFLLIPLFVSGGLLYAGFSGNCMMAHILRYMPWNKAH